VTCDTCSGNGETYSVECNSCEGSGLETSEETVDVEVPSGVFEGMVFIMEGKGHGVKGGNQGDLHIKIMELQHDYYVRNGSDLKLKLKLSYPQLMLGGKVEVITIEGKKIRVTVPEYSDVGSNLRIPFKGLKAYGKETRGDILISLDIDIPKDIDSETREIIEQLKEKLDPKVASEESK
jgi:molecular chaperone DnaJ